MTENNINEETILNLQEQQVEIKRLRGWYVIVMLFLLFAIVNFSPAIVQATKYMFSNWDMHEVGLDLLDYVEKNNQKFPIAEKWCDFMLLEKDDFSFFERYENDKDNFPFTLNKHIFDQEEVPDDMVVLFTGATGWNKMGDYELVQNCDRVQVFFANGSSSIYRKHQIRHLRWKFEDSGIIPEPDIRISFLALSSLVAIVFLTILITCRESVRIFWVLALGVGVVSATAGAFFGGAAEIFYYRLVSMVFFISPWVGGIWGFVTGVSFVALIGSIYRKYNPNVSMVGYSTVIGGITGLATSSIVHGYLMIAYQEDSFVYMLVGSSFGIIAGVLLGWITSGLIKLYKNHPAILSVTSEVS